MTEGVGRPATAEAWAELARRTLRGRSLDDLSTFTRDGIEVRALYTDGPAPPPAVRAADPARSQHGWDVRVSHRLAADADQSALAGLRRQIEADLAGGATSLEIETGEGIDPQALDSVLVAVDLAEIPVSLAPHAGLDTLEALGAVTGRRGVPLAAGSSLGLDPCGEWPRSGRAVGYSPAARWAASAMASSEGHRLGLGAGVRAFTVDAARYSDAGATEAQALGWATATGVAYLRALAEAGLSVDAAAGLIGLRMAATADQFATIAALRAARMIWARVVTAAGGSPAAARQHQHAVAGGHAYRGDDAWMNVLRGTAAALAAGAAGADAVTVMPCDEGEPSSTGRTGHASDAAALHGPLARRLARNTQLLLLEESHLARSGDPAGGSFYLESLTDELATRGWRVLQEVEAAGGMGAYLAAGRVAELLSDAASSD